MLPHIRQAVPGTFYDAEGPFFSPDGQASYRIKWMTPDGRIIWFAVDARSGQIMNGAPRYRPDGDNRGWPRGGNYRDDDGRYGDRGWGRQEGPDRNGGPGVGGSGRYDRGPERGGHGSERGRNDSRPHSNR